MSRRLPVAKLGRLTGGINRFRPEARPDQCVEALDVFEDKGRLRRRPAFKAIHTSAPFRMAAGKSANGGIASNDTITLQNDRAITHLQADLQAGDGVVVGCEDLFDGIEWCHITLANTNPTEHRFLEVSFWTGSAWSVLPYVVDTTWDLLSNGGNYFRVPLVKDGRISWHRSQTTGWATRTEGSRALYFVRLRMLDGAGDTADAETDITTASPGPHGFVLEPVKALLPFRSKQGLECLIVASDRYRDKVTENGAALAIIRSRARAGEIPMLTEDRGAGVFGQVARAAVYDAAAGEAWPGGTWNTTAASSGSDGTVDALTKHYKDYDWLERQFRGSQVASGLVGPGSTTAWGGSLSVAALTGINANLPDGAWENYRIRCTAGTATPVGEEREVLGIAGSSVFYAPTFSVAPDITSLFEILKPHGIVRLAGSTRDYEIADRTTNVEHIQSIVDGEEYTTKIDAADENQQVHFAIGRRFRDVVDGGRLWTALFDLTTRKVLLQNEKSGLLEFDGVHIKRHEAEDDPASARVRQWVGALPDQARTLLSPAALAGSKLRNKPPMGSFVTDFRGRTVVVNGPYSIAWSAPSPDNDIWPKVYETQIRDAENDEITALFTHESSLCVATPTSLHVSDAPDDSGMFRLRPVSAGIGFVAHRSVVRVARGLTMGVTPDGIYAFQGAGLSPVLDDWRRVLPGGVNQAKLRDSVAAVSIHEARAYFAVPSAGSNVNDRILVFDLEQQKWWVWSSPWGGISSMCRDYDSNGLERVLFGTNDGHVARLIEADTDDGDVITGRARSRSIENNTETIAPIAASLVAYEGGSQTLAVNTYLNQHGQRDSIPQTLVPNYEPGLILGTDNWSSDDSTLYGRSLVQKKYSFPRHLRCESFEVELEGTGLWGLDKIDIELSPSSTVESK